MSVPSAGPLIVLASGSPRRRELLEQLGLQFTIAIPEVDETPLPGEAPLPYVQRVAIAKVQAVTAPETALVIAADTTVELGGRIIGKPVDADDARSMLHRLSARSHRVHTGVAMRCGGRTVAETITTLVTFTPLTAEMIEWYVATGEPLDKAGAYALQGAGGVFVQRVQGSVSNVIGLPLHAVARLATELGVALPA